MANFYVSSSGSNTSPYDTWAKAATSIQTALTAATGADYVYVAPGTYTETLDFAGADGLTMERAFPSGVTSGQVIIDGTGAEGVSEVIHITDVNVTIDGKRDLDDTAYGIKVVDPSDGASPTTRCIYVQNTFTGFKMYDVETKSKTANYFAEYVNLYRCRFAGTQGSATVPPSINAHGTIFEEGCHVEACEWRPCAFSTYDAFYRPNFIRLRDTAAASVDADFVNCSFHGFYTYIFQLTDEATVTLNLKNCILGGFNLGIGGAQPAPIKCSTTNTINLTNVQMIPYWNAQGFSLTNGGTPTVNGSPVITQALGMAEIGPAGVGGFAFTIDDGDTDNCQYVADILAQLDSDAGEVCSWYPDNRIDSATLPSGYNTPAELMQACIDAGWEIGIASVDGSGFTTDNETTFKAEVQSALDWLAGHLPNYTVRSLSWPGNIWNDNMQGWLAEMGAGILGARISDETTLALNEDEIYSIPSKACNGAGVGVANTSWFEPDTAEADIKNQGRSVATSLRQHSSIMCLLTHLPAELTVQEAVWFIQGAAESGFLKTFGDLLEEYREYSSEQADGYTHRMVMTDRLDTTLDTDAYAVGNGAKWWTGGNPTGSNGEPFSDMETDIGSYQTTYAALHPANQPK